MRKAMLPLCMAVIAAVMSCARMGQPDGGWYDETPPSVIGASPDDGATNVRQQKISIFFDEFVKIDNATEKVVVSPPQAEMPEIKSAGKKIEVELKDSLRANTTYTIDFSDAISDNNEGNPLGNYAYTFSTGDRIDTLQVSGHVLEAENLEPIKGILVGLYSDMADSAFVSSPMIRIARTDSRGQFVIKGVAPGSYRIYALQDMDGDYKFSQKSEKIAFTTDIITPSTTGATRQDTTWLDSLRIKSISKVGYTRFIPDDIVLKAFTEPLTDRYLIKSERQEPDHFTFFFSYGNDSLPQIKGIGFDSSDAFIIEHSEKRDTVTYWLKDTTLVNRDTLNVQLRYMATDTLGHLQLQTDTLQMLSKKPYERRMKEKKKSFEEWQKQQERRKKRGQPYDSIMPPEPLDYDISVPQKLRPDENIHFEFKTPLANIDISKIHLYSKRDTLWYNAPFELLPDRKDTLDHADTTYAGTHELHLRKYVLMGEWKPDIEYSLEIDSAAFTDIYGKSTKKLKQGFKVSALSEFGTLLLSINGTDGQPIVVQLLDTSDKPVKEVKTSGTTAEFFYIKPGRYYLRMFVDSNNNGIWDTGDYASGRQAEEVFYYPEPVECREKWDISKTWSPRATVLTRQKPSQITKQKAEQTRQVKQRNAERARKLGIEYLPEMQKQMQKRLKRQKK
ncbi:Ig-like domain-containing protein [Prevotella lascolaii]|uniref:Ig-like domain-containing protein n=1 Tax=Leyella lascolaii TaxID=1776379 RepID=A0AAW7JEC3_9BACT|nr:Ig-like domain-containing protein [Leyella lascolaii]MDN0021708.1 Ig-like domain-containing protein [Leyella lascolaii]MDN0024204.1 Ig-like domain-containing protein [Leyella lascolaii]